MSKSAKKEALEMLHAALATSLAEKIRKGEVTAADLNVARQFLKDNHIEASPEPGSPLDDLRKDLPFADPDSIANDYDTIN